MKITKTQLKRLIKEVFDAYSNDGYTAYITGRNGKRHIAWKLEVDGNEDAGDGWFSAGEWQDNGMALTDLELEILSLENEEVLAQMLTDWSY